MRSLTDVPVNRCGSAGEEIDAAYKEMGEQELADLKAAHHNIEAFANAQRQTVKPADNFSPEPESFRTSHHSGRVLLLLCAGRQLSAVFDGADVSDSGEGSGCKTYHRLPPVVRGTGHINAKTLVAMDPAGVDEIHALGGA